MKNYLFLLGIILIIACDKTDLEPVTQEEYNLESFTGLRLEGIGDVQIYPSTEFRVVVETHMDLQNDVRISANGQELVIDFKTSNRKQNKIETLIYHVYVPTLDRITLNDVGNIEAQQGFTTDKLDVRLNDVGNIELHNIISDDVSLINDGVGNIELSGTGDLTVFELRDVGRIEAFDFTANDCTAILDRSSVGSIRCFASERLDARAQGVGNIYYKGNPQDISKSETETSKVIDAE